MMKILVVEDDPIIGNATESWLSDSYSVIWRRDQASALVEIRTTQYDMVILDLGLPDGSGLEVLRVLKRERQDAGVLIMTAYGEIDRRVEGLDLGADDFLVKPIDFKELDARIRAVKRRKDGLTGAIIDHGSLQLDINANVLYRDGERVGLSQREVSILSILMQGRNRYFTKRMLEDRLYDAHAETAGNAVEVHISALRRKLGKDLIKTTRGLGYIIETSSR